jgi:hypothetical protein
MIRVVKNGDKSFAEASVVGRKHVTQPMERLHEAHGGDARPIKAARRYGLEFEGQVAESDWPQAAIGKQTDARRNGVGESEVISGGEAIDHHPDFALAGQRVDHIARVGIGGLSCKPIVVGGVVEAARNPPQVSGSDQSVEGLIDRSARSQVGKSSRVQPRGCASAEIRSRMAAGMLNAGVDMGVALCQQNATNF